MKYRVLVVLISFYGSLLYPVSPDSNTRRKSAAVCQFVDIHLKDHSSDALSLQVIVDSQDKQPRRKKTGRSHNKKQKQQCWYNKHNKRTDYQKYTKISVLIEQKKIIKKFERL